MKLTLQETVTAQGTLERGRTNSTNGVICTEGIKKIEKAEKDLKIIFPWRERVVAKVKNNNSSSNNNKRNVYKESTSIMKEGRKLQGGFRR